MKILICLIWSMMLAQGHADTLKNKIEIQSQLTMTQWLSIAALINSILLAIAMVVTKVMDRRRNKYKKQHSTKIKIPHYIRNKDQTLRDNVGQTHSRNLHCLGPEHLIARFAPDQNTRTVIGGLILMSLQTMHSGDFIAY